MMFHAAERRQPILHKTVLIHQGETREDTQLLFCFTSNAQDGSPCKPFLDRYLMQAGGSASNKPQQLSSILHPLSQLAITRPDPRRASYIRIALVQWQQGDNSASSNKSHAPQKLEQLGTVPLLTFQAKKEILSPYLPHVRGTRYPAHESPIRKKSS